MLEAGAITGVISGSWVLVRGRRKDDPGWLRWHLTLITSPTRSLAREARKAIMYLGVKTEREAYKDKREPVDWPMGPGSLSEGKEANKEGATRGKGNNKTHWRMEQGAKGEHK